MNEKSNDENADAAMTSTLKDDNNRLNEQIRSLEAELADSKEYTVNELQKQRKEFENRVSASQEEIRILQGLVDEQKQQLIAAYTENEEEMQQKVQQITELGLQVQKLRAELEKAEQQMVQTNNAYVDNLKQKLNEMQTLFDENNELIRSQAVDLANKQETIETLNQQIMDLYAAMEQQGSELNDKDDEINRLQDTIDRQSKQVRELEQRQQSHDKRVKDLEAQLAATEAQIESVRSNLEAKNKEQLEKLKKFAANLKKKNGQYAELETKYKELEAMKSGDVSISADNGESEKQRQEIERLQQQINQLESVAKFESVPLQQSAPATSSSQSHLAVELNELKDTVDHLHTVIGDKDADIGSLQQKIEHGQAELENIKLRLSEKVLLVDQLTAELQVKSTELIEARNSLAKFDEIKIQFEETEADLKSKNIKIEKCKAIIKERNKEIKRFVLNTHTHIYILISGTNTPIFYFFFFMQVKRTGSNIDRSAVAANRFQCGYRAFAARARQCANRIGQLSFGNGNKVTGERVANRNIGK